MDPRLSPRPAQIANRLPPRQDINAPSRGMPQPINPIAMATTEETTAAPAASVPAPQPPPQPVAAPPSQLTEPIKAQLVGSIPVKQQGQAQAAHPSTPSAPVHKPDIVDGHDELNQILEAVNNRIKSPAAPAGTPQKQKLKLKLPKLTAGQKPIGVAIAAIAVALALSAVAVYAYRQGKHSLASQAGKVGTTSAASDAVQNAGGVLVHPSDLDDFSQALQTKLNGLNDSQDFDSSPLSDKMLGL